MFDMDFDPVSTNFYTRTSRSKYEDTCPISKIEDYQTSMSVFSTRIESKNNRANNFLHIYNNIVRIAENQDY